MIDHHLLDDHYPLPRKAARMSDTITRKIPAPILPEAVRHQRAFASDLDSVLEEIRATLIAKNAAYGDSALDPLRLFSQADPVEQLKVRIDDKISRIPVGQVLEALVLLRIAGRRRERMASGLTETPL